MPDFLTVKKDPPPPPPPPTQEKEITVIVTEANNKAEYKFKVNDIMTVGDLKKQLSGKISKSEDRIKLTHRDKTLDDKSKIWDHVGLNNVPIYASIGSGGSYAQK